MVAQLHNILLAGSNLLQLESAAGQARNLESVLNARLENFYASLSKDRPLPVPNTIQDLHLETAQCALELIEQAHRFLDDKLQGRTPDDAPIGSRDLAQLRTLLTMVFRWGVSPLLARISGVWSSKLASRVGPRDIELTKVSEDYGSLSSLLMRLAAILLPHGAHGRLSQTLIATSILERHMLDFLKASMALGWLPKSLTSENARAVDAFRPVVLRLLEFVPLSQIIADLGTILSTCPPPHVRRLCSSLLSKSLLRDKGINALLTVVFGDEDTLEDALLEKYERVGQILRFIPAGMKPEVYFTAVIPGILRILSSNNVPPTHLRAASFSFARMLDPEFTHRELVSRIALPIIHSSLTFPPACDSQSEGIANSSEPMRPSQALSTICTLLNSDPSPILATLVLSQILPSLYALMYYFDKTRASDPVLRDSVKTLLMTWGRIVECHEGVEKLWLVLHGGRITWKVSESDEIVCVSANSREEKFALLMPEERRRKGENEDGDAFDLYPDAAHFVQYIKSLDRSDINSELFVRLLEVYYSSHRDKESDPMRMLLYLQTIMQMRAQLSGESSPQSILSKPEHILQFVKQALEPTTDATSSTKAHSESRYGMGLEDLRIIPEDDVEFDEVGDSDDEEPAKVNSNRDEEMTDTAINLLLATLEANPDLSARNAPILNVIFSLLDPYAACSLPSIRTLAREARMVITARLASTSTEWPSPQAKGESAQEIYQKALKLLQDPILPVRAHGLLLLRQLVSTHSPTSSNIITTESALVPAILSIFMQSVQEDDSYIFLNAVQGLSAMVDAFGKEVLNSLLETYTRDSTGYLTAQDVDTKIRVGEALGQVIRRCGDSLGKYTDTVVPRLIAVFRANQAPAVLRASAISLLTECIKTSLMALTWYTNELSVAMIDLLQVEMVSSSRTSSTHNGPKNKMNKSEDSGKKPTLDTEIDATPSVVDPKIPSLRRSALHFLTLLIQTLTQAVYDGSTVKLPSAPFLRRAKTTLGYISSVDEDGIARMMAREAGEGIDQLMKAVLGVE